MRTYRWLRFVTNVLSYIDSLERVAEMVTEKHDHGDYHCLKGEFGDDGCDLCDALSDVRLQKGKIDMEAKRP